jgi:hypothetical protein
MYKLYKEASKRTAHFHPLEAQVSWQKVSGAASYELVRPDGAKQPVKNAIPHFLDPQDVVKHTVLPLDNGGTSPMKDAWRDGGGYVHLTYHLYAVDEHGNRSRPANVDITVARSLFDPSLDDWERQVLQSPAASCGHEQQEGTEPVATYTPASTSAAPRTFAPPQVTCTNITRANGDKAVQISWGDVPGATGYSVWVPNKGGSGTRGPNSVTLGGHDFKVGSRDYGPTSTQTVGIHAIYGANGPASLPTLVYVDVTPQHGPVPWTLAQASCSSATEPTEQSVHQVPVVTCTDGANPNSNAPNSVRIGWAVSSAADGVAMLAPSVNGPVFAGMRPIDVRELSAGEVPGAYDTAPSRHSVAVAAWDRETGEVGGMATVDVVVIPGRLSPTWAPPTIACA